MCSMWTVYTLWTVLRCHACCMPLLQAGESPGMSDASSQAEEEAPSMSGMSTQAPEAKPLLGMGHGGPLVVADQARELFNMGFYDAKPEVPAPANPADAAVIIPWGTTMDKIAIHVSSQPSKPGLCRMRVQDACVYCFKCAVQPLDSSCSSGIHFIAMSQSL